MLTYTFSKREKVLLLILAIFLVIVAWYQFVFVTCQDQIDQLNSQIADAQDELSVDTVKAQQIQPMRDAIAQYQAEGIQPTVMPNYDNTQPLMAELNTTLARANTYTLDFDDVDTGDGSAGTIAQRGVTLTFGCDSYETARAIALALVHGSFPCSIDQLTMTDNVATAAATSSGIVGSNGSGGQNFSVSAHLTFYEKIPQATTGTDTGDGSSGDESSATQLGDSLGMVNAGRGTGQRVLTEGTGNGSTAGSNAASSSN